MNPEFLGLAYLLSLPPWLGKGKFGIDRPKLILEALGNPQDKVSAIHITGTNGKGTTSASIASILQEAGYKVGLNTSPHLVSVTERIQINREQIAEERLDQLVLEIKAVADSMDIILSPFEYETISAFLYFSREQVDWMVIEVGLGGRLDATNTMLAPKVTAITSIGLDHVEQLGDTFGKIAAEKVMIARKGVPMFVSEVPVSAKEVICYLTSQIGADLEFCGEHFTIDWDNYLLNSKDGSCSLKNSSYFIRHQYLNAALAARIALYLKIPADIIERGLKKTVWPGRLELFKVRSQTESSPLILLDGAHNSQGMEALLNYLNLRYIESGLSQKISFLISILETKDWNEMLSQLLRFSAKNGCSFYFTTSGAQSALAPELLCRGLGKGVVVASAEEHLLSYINSAETNSLLVVSGSLYLIGKLRPLLLELCSPE